MTFLRPASALRVPAFENSIYMCLKMFFPHVYIPTQNFYLNTYRKVYMETEFCLMLKEFQRKAYKTGCNYRQ